MSWAKWAENQMHLRRVFKNMKVEQEVAINDEMNQMIGFSKLFGAHSRANPLSLINDYEYV